MMCFRFLVPALVPLLAAGCVQGIPPEALALRPQALQLRQLQSRRFSTGDEKLILASCVALLQDLEFTLEETSSDLGLVVASKDRSAIETGQVVGSLIIAILGGKSQPTDKEQRFRASVVTRLSEDKKSVGVRVTFQRIVWNTANQVSKNEALENPEFYQAFFEKLSKAVFLEANEF
jgi:hypothetical protein